MYICLQLAKHNPNYGSVESVHEELKGLKSMDSDDEEGWAVA